MKMSRYLDCGEGTGSKSDIISGFVNLFVNLITSLILP